MTENYISLSLETHLFFARIMKEHALFLQAGFPCKEKEWINTADNYRQKFDEFLLDVVKLSNRRISQTVLNSGELVTEFTLEAEKKTSCLTGVSINTDLTLMEQNLKPGPSRDNNCDNFRIINQLNQRSINLLNGLISFKENILNEVNSCRLFTTNYPLLLEHVLDEARLYRTIIDNLMHNRPVRYNESFGTEDFWNHIMMEHGLFIRGLLNPCEEDLIIMADEFAKNYKRLLDLSNSRGCISNQDLNRESLEETLKFQNFKTAGTKGILGCEISSIIIPLLSDHVLREANHYIRLLEMTNSR